MGVDPWVDRGTCPPYFLSPLLFWEQTLFVMHSTDCRRLDSAKTVTRITGCAVASALCVTYNGGLDPLVANDFNFI